MDALHTPGGSLKDWVADFPHENGTYINKCSVCKDRFWGYKRRVVCKVCDGADDPEKVVGHKTFSDGKGGHYHDPLLRREADAIWEATEVARREREAAMPDEETAIRTMFNAWLRLKDFGWREWTYMPKDGTTVDLIEAGSTGIHQGYYMGEWPKGSVWVMADGDLWPSNPTLYRDRAPDIQDTKPAAHLTPNPQ